MNHDMKSLIRHYIIIRLNIIWNDGCVKRHCMDKQYLHPFVTFNELL